MAQVAEIKRGYPNPSKHGKISFEYPDTGLKGETAYWLWGDLSSSKVPLIILHGGPGIPHQYLLSCARISADLGNPVLMYDQVGCGDSTRFTDKKGDAKFWTPEMFVAELDNVRSHLNIPKYHLLGHSWGGMLAAEYAVRQREGLQKLILADSPSSMPLWAAATNQLRKTLPQEIQDVLDRCERDGTTDSPEYEAAVMQYYARFVCSLEDWPKELQQSLEAVAKDNTVYESMNGPNEFSQTGSLKDWSVIQSLHQITEQTCPGGVLLLNGRYDGASDDAVTPFFEKIQAKVRWATFSLSSHTPHLEEPERFFTILGSFLASD